MQQKKKDLGPNPWLCCNKCVTVEQILKFLDT